MSKKVVIFIPAIEKGGVEKNAIWLANEMVNHFFDVDIVYVRADINQLKKLNDKVKQIKLKNRKYKLLHQRIGDAINVRREFGRYLKSQNNSQTVVVSFQSSSVAIDICKKNNIKIVCRLSNHPSAVKYEKSMLRAVSEKIKPITYKKADCVIANSEQLSQDFSDLIGKKVETIYNPIDFKMLELCSQEKIEKELELEAKEFQGRLFVSVGRLVKQKDYMTLIEAVSKSKYKDEIKVWIIGEGSDRDMLRVAIREHKLQDTIRLLGYKPNVYSYLSHASVFIQTSLYEGCPNSLIEAVAVGLPAIATNCLSGPGEVLLDGLGGRLVPIKDSIELANAIDEFVEKPDEFYKMAERARKKIYRFDADNTINKYVEIVNSLLDR